MPKIIIWVYLISLTAAVPDLAVRPLVTDDEGVSARFDIEPASGNPCLLLGAKNKLNDGLTVNASCILAPESPGANILSFGLSAEF